LPLRAGRGSPTPPEQPGQLPLLPPPGVPCSPPHRSSPSLPPPAAPPSSPPHHPHRRQRHVHDALRGPAHEGCLSGHPHRDGGGRPRRRSELPPGPPPHLSPAHRPDPGRHRDHLVRVHLERVPLRLRPLLLASG